MKWHLLSEKMPKPETIVLAAWRASPDFFPSGWQYALAVWNGGGNGGIWRELDEDGDTEYAEPTCWAPINAPRLADRATDSRENGNG